MFLKGPYKQDPWGQISHYTQEEQKAFSHHQAEEIVDLFQANQKTHKSI